MADNLKFQVGGSGRSTLEQTIALVMRLSGHKEIVGWLHIPDRGIVLLWSPIEQPDPRVGLLPGPLKDPGAIAVFVEAYLNGPLVQEVDMKACPGDSKYEDGDVDNKRGWLVYVEEWGHVANLWQAAFAVCPHYLWHGK